MLAIRRSEGQMIDWIAEAAHVPGDVIQLRDGRAAVVSDYVASGASVGVYIDGIFEVPKTASVVVLMGSRLFWDYSADKCHVKHGNDRDFFLGCAVGGGPTHITTATSAGVSGPTIAATAAGTAVRVNLNMKAHNEHSLQSGYTSVPVYTAGINIGAFGTGEGVNLIKDATAEAQKVDALSFRAFDKAASAIIDALICVNSDSNAASDTSVGIANATHATDADSITEHLLVHLDGGSTNINLQSKDGTTTVAATNSTVAYTAGTPFLVQFDTSDLTDIQAYIDGVNVLGSTAFKLNAATGPFKLLAHSEKSGTATAGNVSVLSLVARPARV
jgi:predicted RecA/RadA family phage recombinase